MCIVKQKKIFVERSWKINFMKFLMKINFAFFDLSVGPDLSECEEIVDQKRAGFMSNC